MMFHISKIADLWFGLCRKPPVVHIMQSGFGFPKESASVGLPESGGGSGSGSIRRGTGAVLSGVRMLNRNRQLLWFTLLAGLVLVGNAIGQAVYWYLGYNLHIQIDWVAWQFFIELVTMLFFVYLLAGLVLSVPLKKGGPVSFFKGLCGTKRYIRPLTCWSVFLALAGMLLVIIFWYVPAWFPTPELLEIYRNGFGSFYSFLMNTLSQFPFNLTLRWDLFTEIPGYGERSVLLWIYPGFRDALIFLAINLLLFILTPFVVPLIVLEQKTPVEAVMESFTMLKKTWAEAAACALTLGVIVSGVLVSYLLIGAAHGMFAPHEVVTYHLTVPWIAIAILYDLALFSIAFIVATIGGIAVLDLYRSVKTGQAP